MSPLGKLHDEARDIGPEAWEAIAEQLLAYLVRAGNVEGCQRLASAANTATQGARHQQALEDCRRLGEDETRDRAYRDQHLRLVEVQLTGARR